MKRDFLPLVLVSMFFLISFNFSFVSAVNVTVDPTQLPLASGQLRNATAYNALNVPALAAGGSYADPVTGIIVRKVTSSSTPVSNTVGAGNEYADGGNRISLPWGINKDKYTIMVMVQRPAIERWLVDYQIGGTFSNWRQLNSSLAPGSDLQFSFSNNPDTPRIAYVVNGGDLKRIDTETMTLANTGNFPETGVWSFWLHQDRFDKWFVSLTSSSSAVAWNSQTNERREYAETWLDEPRLERDGRFLMLSGGGNTLKIVDLQQNTTGLTQTVPIDFWFAHNAGLRGHWITGNPNFAFSVGGLVDRYDPSLLDILSVVKTTVLVGATGNSGIHHAGNWIQTDAELNGNPLKQWSALTTYRAVGTEGDWDANVRWKSSIGLVRSDGSDYRLVAHHYSSASPSYWQIPWGNPSPDGRLIMFNSNMNTGSTSRHDLFLVEMPVISSNSSNDTTPPVRSSGSPSGNISAGTTQTTLSMNTDETAACKYGTIPGTAYPSIANTFSTTGSTNHSQLITGLTDGTLYNYYVRCNDTSGNVNTNDFTISFGINPTQFGLNPMGTEPNGTSRNRDWIFVNVSVAEPNLKNITYSLYNSLGIVNETSYTTLVKEINWTGLPNNNIQYRYNVGIYDLAGNFNSTETRYITLVQDLQPPIVTIISPENITYSAGVTQLNYFVTDDTSLSACWYSLNGGATNSSPDATCANLTGLTSTEGSNTWTVYANDSVGNVGSDSVTFIKDTTAPIMNYAAPTEDSGLFKSQNFINVNVTASDSFAGLSTITIRLFNSAGSQIGINTSTSSPFYITYSGLADGLYYYNSTANDILGNTATLTTRNITLDTIAPGINFI